MIFVFGSNKEGLHAGGAARHALEHCGSIWGQGEGLQGESYALPTMGTWQEIEDAVHLFRCFAAKHPELQFKITRIGCGIAGLKDEKVAPLFLNAPDNCFFDEVWREWLPNEKFWGTF